MMPMPMRRHRHCSSAAAAAAAATAKRHHCNIQPPHNAASQHQRAATIPQRHRQAVIPALFWPMLIIVI
jgi:hypothetical protein